MLREYTDRFHGFQIRDISYFGEPPETAEAFVDYSNTVLAEEHNEKESEEP